MEKFIFARYYIYRCFVLAVSCCILIGCASSNVSRDVTYNIDHGRKNANRLVTDAAESNIADTYWNSTQAAKGALIGGAAGAITGSLSPGIGLLPGTAIGAILGASYGKYIDANTTLKDRLINRGVNVIVLGDQILIVIPSDRLFDPYTASIKPQAYSTIALVAAYINQYVKMLVRVNAYTSRTGSQTLDESLSEQQAQRVAKALLKCGIDARVLYAEGLGGCKIVTADTGVWESDNYRIEITLEKLYV